MLRFAAAFCVVLGLLGCALNAAEAKPIELFS